MRARAVEESGVNVERPQAVRPRTDDVDAGDGWRTLTTGGCPAGCQVRGGTR